MSKKLQPERHQLQGGGSMEQGPMHSLHVQGKGKNRVLIGKHQISDMELWLLSA